MTAVDAAPALARARRLALATAAVLAACVAYATARSGPWPANLVWTVVMLLPVLAPLPGLARGRRRTYAWATLCVAPYLIFGIMEVVANPALRAPGAAILFASLAWFVTLIACLRLSRGVATPPQTAPDA